MAQYVIGHQARVARIRELTPSGLHLVGNGYDGVGIPDVVAQAAAVFGSSPGEGLGASAAGRTTPVSRRCDVGPSPENPHQASDGTAAGGQRPAAGT